MYLFSLLHGIQGEIRLYQVPLFDDLVQPQKRYLHFRCDLVQIGQTDRVLLR